MSIIRQIVESIAAELSAHVYFRTVPRIPVLVEDHKDIETQITNAANSTGAFVMVSFSDADTDSQDTPGPYLSDSNFKVTVSEIPSVWRSRQGSTPSCTEIAEACARLIHHHQPKAKDGSALSGGVLIFSGMEQSLLPSTLVQTITFQIPIGLSNLTPTR
jgi:hypothetical protein